MAIAIQFTKDVYAWIAREGGAVNATPTGSTAAASTAAALNDPEIDDLTSRFERMGGSWYQQKLKE
ncbi:hypothetical protein E4U46_007838 [Claviceps purpurea]|nr:hypothetical protein E4U27_007006 [Claviceps purpurea]KAG6260863.1 hypothetical protein E4U49_004459 [Claviceps purpurea]KAG6283274.1 hypothetical protein E4U46_007838 [Claviceps purpurea]